MDKLNAPKLKTKTAGMLGIHRNKHAALIQDGDKFLCIDGYKPTEDGSGYTYDHIMEFRNPREAGVSYSSILSGEFLKWYESWLDEHGYDRYNGQRKEEAP